MLLSEFVIGKIYADTLLLQFLFKNIEKETCFFLKMLLN
jgi:hypothetical protein